MNQYGSLPTVPKWESVPCTVKAKAGTHVDQQDFYQRNSQAHSTINMCLNMRHQQSWKHSWNGRISCCVESLLWLLTTNVLNISRHSQTCHWGRQGGGNTFDWDWSKLNWASLTMYVDMWNDIADSNVECVNWKDNRLSRFVVKWDESWGIYNGMFEIIHGFLTLILPFKSNIFLQKLSEWSGSVRKLLIHICIMPANPRNPWRCVVFCGEGHLRILEIWDVSGSCPS